MNGSKQLPLKGKKKQYKFIISLYHLYLSLAKQLKIHKIKSMKTIKKGTNPSYTEKNDKFYICL